MNPTDTSRGEWQSAGNRLAMLCLLLVLQAVWLNPALATAAHHDLGIEEHSGAFVLELDTPSPKARGRCLDIVVSNFAVLRARKLWLVVRHAAEGSRPVYETVALVDAPTDRVGNAQVCPREVPYALRAQGNTPGVLQVAVYGVTPRDLAAGHWSGPADDGLRLSNWLSLPGTLLRNRLPADPRSAPRSAKLRTAP